LLARIQFPDRSVFVVDLDLHQVAGFRSFRGYNPGGSRHYVQVTQSGTALFHGRAKGRTFFRPIQFFALPRSPRGALS